jgi:hypothetical protein
VIAVQLPVRSFVLPSACGVRADPTRKVIRDMYNGPQKAEKPHPQIQIPDLPDSRIPTTGQSPSRAVRLQVRLEEPRAAGTVSQIK